MQQREARALQTLQTPSAAAATPTAAAGHSPPGITFTRSTALGLPSPVLAGLFGGADSSDMQQHSGGGGGGYTPSNTGGAVEDTPAGSDGRSERCVGGAVGGGKDVSGAAARAAGGADQGGADGAEETRGGGPSQGRKGPKLELGARSRTVPVGGTQGSPEGG